MNLQDKRLRILVIGVVIILGIVAFRVISNIMARNEQAKKSNQGRTAVIMADYPKRQTIVPKFRFSGTLDPIWQADVAAKVDGRIEKVLATGFPWMRPKGTPPNRISVIWMFP